MRRLAPLLLAVALTACGHAAARPPAPATPAPLYAVGLRTLTFVDPSRVTDSTPGQAGGETQGRALVTTVWYPASGATGGSARNDAPPARGGPFPVVLFSQGLLGVPLDYHAIAERWAAAGLVVAAPAYPLTNRGAAHVQALDVVNQPGDASFVLTALLRQAGAAGDRFHGLLDGSRLAAAGHSAGAITTVGLFSTCCRDARLRAGVVLAGNSLGFGGYAGGPAPVLFEHGDKDPIVPYFSGRLAWEGLAWPKAFVTLEGQSHIDPYLQPATPAFAVVADTTTAFLRWSLRGDPAALAAFRTSATAPGLAHVDDRLGGA
jgi:dienelactone hydrolase